MSAAPCMGGWCAKRDHCPHYRAAKRSEPAERLCPPGQDGAMLTGSTLSAVQMVQVRHKERLATDPRFAAWAAGAPA